MWNQRMIQTSVGAKSANWNINSKWNQSNLALPSFNVMLRMIQFAVTLAWMFIRLLSGDGMICVMARTSIWGHYTRIKLSRPPYGIWEIRLQAQAQIVPWYALTNWKTKSFHLKIRYVQDFLCAINHLTFWKNCILDTFLASNLSRIQVNDPT